MLELTVPPPNNILYKYRSIESSHTQSILRGGEIYFPTPEKLNDPCEYFFIFDEGYSDRDITREMFYGAKMSPQILRKNDNGTLRVRFTPEQKTQYFMSIIMNHNNQGVFSLSESNTIIEMFSFYADSSNGICIGFEWEQFKLPFSDDSIVCVPKKIEYSDTPLIIQGTPHDWYSVFTNKYTGFKFEKEWRLFYNKGLYISNDIRLAIRSITFGPRFFHQDKKMWESKLNEIREWTKDLTIQLYRTEPIVGQYRLRASLLDL